MGKDTDCVPAAIGCSLPPLLPPSPHKQVIVKYDPCFCWHLFLLALVFVGIDYSERTAMPSTNSSRLYYGWVVVAITALALLISAGVRSAPGVFLVPVQEDTQWSIGVISFAA